MGMTSTPLGGRASLPPLGLKGINLKLPTLSRVRVRSTAGQGGDASDGVAKAQGQKKYYAPAPGNPNVILEYDEPPVVERIKGRFDLKAIAVLTFGCCMILAFFITLVTIV